MDGADIDFGSECLMNSDGSEHDAGINARRQLCSTSFRRTGKIIDQLASMSRAAAHFKLFAPGRSAMCPEFLMIIAAGYVPEDDHPPRRAADDSQAARGRLLFGAADAIVSAHRCRTSRVNCR